MEELTPLEAVFIAALSDRAIDATKSSGVWDEVKGRYFAPHKRPRSNP